MNAHPNSLAQTGRRVFLLACLLTGVCGQPLAAGTATAAASSPGVTDQEIVVGMSAPFSGASRDLGHDLYRGTMAYLMEVNASGGVHGRKITVLAYDDGYDPEIAVQNTLRLIEQDRVFVLFNYVGTASITRQLPLLKKYAAQHFLLLFPFSGGEASRLPPYDQQAFNLRASYRQETSRLVGQLLAVRRSRIAVLYQSDAYGRSGWVGVRDALAERQLDIVAEATYARGAKSAQSFQRQVAILQKASPDAIVCICTSAAGAGFIRDARKARVDVPIANVSFAGSRTLLTLLTQDGARDGTDYTGNLINSEVVPSYQSLDLAAVREYRTLIDKHHPSYPGELPGQDYQSSPYTSVALEGFLNAKLLVESLRRLGPRPARADMASAIRGIDGFDIGLGSPVSFSPARNQGSDVVYFSTVVKGSIVPLDNWSQWSK